MKKRYGDPVLNVVGKSRSRRDRCRMARLLSKSIHSETEVYLFTTHFSRRIFIDGSHLHRHKQSSQRPLPPGRSRHSGGGHLGWGDGSLYHQTLDVSVNHHKCMPTSSRNFSPITFMFLSWSALLVLFVPHSLL